MRNIVAIVLSTIFAGCMYSSPAGSFTAHTSFNEKINGHCVNDPSSLEATAFRARAKELLRATSDASSVPGFRSVTIEKPDYRYILYVPENISPDSYHVACPTTGDRSSCILAGSDSGGSFEAYISLESAARVQAAAETAFARCKQ